MANSFNIEDSIYSEIVFSTVHYIITMIFFLTVLMNIISLTMATINMSVNSSDTNAVTARDLMISAQVITYIGILVIFVFLGISYSYSDTKNDNSYYATAMSYTGTKDIYSMMRFITFSILMFISVVVSALCLAAAKEIDKSDDPSQYNDQYNLCKEMGRMFFLHFVFFSTLQGGSYVYKLLYNNGSIKKVPGQRGSGKKINTKTEEPEEPEEPEKSIEDIDVSVF